MNWTNILVGIAQVLIPVGIAYAESQGWLPNNTVVNTITALTTAAAATHSAATTKVTTAS